MRAFRPVSRGDDGCPSVRSGVLLFAGSMNFEKKLALTLAAVLLGFLPLLVGSYLSFRRVVSEQNDLVSRNARDLFLAERLQYENARESALMPAFVLSGDRRLIGGFREGHLKIREIAEQLKATETQPAARQRLERIEDLSERLAALAEPGIRMRQRGASVAEVNRYFENEIAGQRRRMDDLLKALTAHETADFAAARAEVDRTVNRAAAALLILSVLACALVGVTGVLVTKLLRQKRAYDRAQAELLEQERRISKARKEAVEVVAHDLKNPLGAIRMGVDFMLMQLGSAADPEDLRDSLRIARRSAETMNKLIMGLLDHAKIEAGTLVLEKSACDLGAFARELADRFRPLAREKGIELSVETGSGPLVAECDPARIDQVLSNFVGNALKFTPENGHVRIRAGTDGPEVVVSVEDDGRGIPGDQLGHVFERFWQARETSKQGTGLGLAIAKEIVESHRGRIWAESEPGRGSRFSFALPTERATISV